MGEKDASVPQNDRELILEVKGDVKLLATEIRNLAKVMKEVQQDEIKPLHTRITNVEAWQYRFDGSWKAIIAIGIILSILATALELKALFGK